LTFRF